MRKQTKSNLQNVKEGIIVFDFWIDNCFLDFLNSETTISPEHVITIKNEVTQKYARFPTHFGTLTKVVEWVKELFFRKLNENYASFTKEKFVTWCKEYPKKLYYAHPISTYNDIIEHQDLKAIELIFKHCQIFNPNLKESKKTYINEIKGFIDFVNACDILVFRSFMDTEIGTGTFEDISNTFKDNKTVYEILDSNSIKKISSIQEISQRQLDKELTFEYLKYGFK